MLSRRNYKSLVMTVAVAITCSLIYCADSVAQRGKSRGGGVDISLILTRLDINKNGYLDPSELKGPTQQFVKNAGLDINRSHPIKTVVDLVKNKGKKTKDSKNSTDKTRTIPGFGVDVELVGVPDFSPTGEERMSAEAMKRRFGANIMSQVERTISRYDRNKTGILEASEVSRARWSNPTSAESDTNKDGSLTRLELAYRYKGREDAAKKRQSSSRNISTRINASKAKPTANTPSFRNNRTSLRNRTTARGKATPSRSNSSASKSGFNSGSDAYKRYAEGLLKNYDKDKDQRLSKTELEEMRRPPKNADANRDGYVDKSELIASVEKRSGVKSNSRQESANNSNAADKLRRPSNKEYNPADSIFGGKDTNNDRQLQMSEFSDEWDEKIVEDFESKDRNKDGVITEQEWRGSR